MLRKTNGARRAFTPVVALLAVAGIGCQPASRSGDGDSVVPLSVVPVAELYREPADSVILAAARALMLADSNVALVTVDESGQPRARTVKAFLDSPVEGVPGRGVTVWIMTRFTTRKVDQVRRNPNVTLYFNDDARVEYATVMGQGIVHTDPENPDAKRVYEASGFRDFFWPDFPEGFVMIEVKPRWLEYLGPEMPGHEETWRPRAVAFEETRQ